MIIHRVYLGLLLVHTISDMPMVYLGLLPVRTIPDTPTVYRQYAQFLIRQCLISVCHQYAQFLICQWFISVYCQSVFLSGACATADVGCTSRREFTLVREVQTTAVSRRLRKTDWCFYSVFVFNPPILTNQ